MTSKQPDLSGKRAMVVGAEHPAGGVIARAYAEAGADVALCALTPDEAVMRSRRVRRVIEAMGRRATEYVMDVTLGRNVQVTTRQVAKELGGLDIVASAPDLFLAKPIDRISDTELARVLQLCFSAQFFVLRTAAEEFRRQHTPGRIVLVTNVLGAHGVANATAYGAAHGGVHQLVRAAAEELRDDGIVVNAIALGVTEDMQAELERDHGVTVGVPLDELGPLAVALSSAGTTPEVTGQVFDGGLSQLP